MVDITFYHHFFCSWYMTKHISHTCGRRSWRPARYLSSSTHSYTSKQCLATALRVSSSITTRRYVLSKDFNPKRLGSENSAMNEAQQAQTQWRRWYIVAATLAVASCIFIFGTTPIPGELFCLDFFEMYQKMTGSSAKLDQWNTKFVGILLGQTPAIAVAAAMIAPLDETLNKHAEIWRAWDT